MPQTLLPCFPPENTPINDLVSFCRREGSVYYFHGCLPVFTHAVEDLRSFRMFTSQLVVNGNCSQAEVVRAFGISSVSMKRYVKLYRAGGPPAFFKQPGRRGATVLTGAVSAQAQALLSAGVDRLAVARQLGLKPNTLAKAFHGGRLVEPKTKAGTVA